MAENTKYKMTDEEKILDDGTKVYRIMALEDINVQHSEIEEGDLGGFIEKEDNLSFEDYDVSWVKDDAVVYGDSVVCEDSIIEHDDTIINNSSVTFNSNIEGSTILDSTISNSYVCGEKNVVDSSEVMRSIINNVDVEASKLYSESFKDVDSIVGYISSDIKLTDDDLADLNDLEDDLII